MKRVVTLVTIQQRINASHRNNRMIIMLCKIKMLLIIYHLILPLIRAKLLWILYVRRANSYFVSSEEKWSFLDSFFGFFLPVSIFRSRGNFFSRGTREKKTQGTEIGIGRKKHSRRAEKKRPKYVPLFETRCRKLFIF